MSSLRNAVEDRKADAVTHLAFARSQNTGNGILGQKRITNDKRNYRRWFLIFLQKIEYIQDHKYIDYMKKRMDKK